MRAAAIYQPDGQIISDSVRLTRKRARKDFAAENGTKWGHLWELGYRCRGTALCLFLAGCASFPAGESEVAYLRSSVLILEAQRNAAYQMAAEAMDVCR